MSGAGLIDPELVRQINDGHRRLPAGLMDMRLNLRLSRDRLAKRMGLSDSGLGNLETLRRGLKPATLIHWCKALGLPRYMNDVVLHQFLPGLFDVKVGQWPPKISPGLRLYMDSIPFPVILLATPVQDVLYLNPEARRMSPWMAPAPDTATEPVNLVIAGMTHPGARENWLNWRELIHKAVFLLRVRGEGIVDPQRLAEIKEAGAVNPEFAPMWDTFLDEDAMLRNISVLRDPDTGEQIEYKTFTFRILYGDVGDENAGEVAVMVPTNPPAGVASTK